MKRIVSTLPTAISTGDVYELEAGEHRHVSALVGSLWITQLGKPDDIVLQAGEAIDLVHPGPAVITSLGGDAILRALWDIPSASAA